MFMYSYCYVCSVLCILLHCVVLCIVCVQMCTVLLPPGVNPIAVNKYSGVSKVGGLGCSNPPRNSEGPPKLCPTQPDLRKLLKIAEFRAPTPQDVRKKGSKIPKLPRFATVLY